jgi:hypothetical protein
MTAAHPASTKPAFTSLPPTGPFNVAVVRWVPVDGMAEAIHAALTTLGHAASLVDWDRPLPREAQVVFSQGPYGHFLEVPYQLGRRPARERPVLVHWNDEGLPDLKLPWALMAGIGSARSWLGRLPYSASPVARRLAKTPPVRWMNRRMKRFSYLGDYHFAYRRGWLTLLVDFSQLYAELHTRHGLPTLAVPWGSVPGPAWYADLGLERDIDVLWMGARAGRRRSGLIDRVRADLRALGIEMYVADNEEHPFIWGEERTRFLNRAKITLNLTRTWYDDNFLRFPIVMPNRSLVVSEPLLAHCTDYVAGTHYVAAPVADLARTIHYYLQNEAERRRIVAEAYELVTTKLTLENRVSRIMAAVAERVRA